MELSDIKAALPGAIGASHLKVYNTPAPDGLRGGSPHVHFACTEAYAVIGGQGAVQTLSAAGFEETPLNPGTLVWFAPGVIHRLINSDGRLEILVLMQNAGLPEAGDWVLTMPAEILQDEQAYWGAVSLASAAEVYASDTEAAQNRRDLAVTGFTALRRDFEHQGVPALEWFYSTALRLVQPRLDMWRERWSSGPQAAAQRTGDQLDELGQGRFEHLFEGRLFASPAPDGERKLGMCGTLGFYLPEGLA